MVEINEDITFMDTSTNTPLSYDWDFNDGTVLIGTTLNPVTHKYDVPGNYTITHKSYNACGPSTNTCTKPLTVTALTTGGSSPVPLLIAAGIGILMMLKK